MDRPLADPPQLQLKIVQADEMERMGSPECPICYQQFEQGDEVAATHCRHRFHVSCIADWFLQVR